MATLTYSDLVTLILYGKTSDVDREIARLSEDYSILASLYSVSR